MCCGTLNSRVSRKVVRRRQVNLHCATKAYYATTVTTPPPPPASEVHSSSSLPPPRHAAATDQLQHPVQRRPERHARPPVRPRVPSSPQSGRQAAPASTSRRPPVTRHIRPLRWSQRRPDSQCDSLPAAGSNVGPRPGARTRLVDVVFTHVGEHVLRRPVVIRIHNYMYMHKCASRM